MSLERASHLRLRKCHQVPGWSGMMGCEEVRSVGVRERHCVVIGAITVKDPSACRFACCVSIRYREHAGSHQSCHWRPVAKARCQEDKLCVKDAWDSNMCIPVAACSMLDVAQERRYRA